MKLLNTLLLLTFLLAGYNSQAMLVEKQLFEIKSFKTENGALINPVKVGWEAYGTLNTDKSNVILITHFFSGSSHAAGKYSEADAAPGYWDAIIGPGKAIDTNKYYVISVDTLVNANVFDPNVITTGPATINPATGKPYGLSFPVVTIGDFVEVQKALLDSLGVDKLHAVVGGSMGSFQAIEWATRYPERVERLIPVIGTAYIDAWAAVRLERWAYPIKQDPAPYTDQAPHQDILASFSAWDQLMAHAKVRAKMQDANHILYLIRASQLYRAGMGDNWQQALSRVQANTLFLPASGDQLLLPHMAKTSVEAMKAAGKTVEYAEIPGIWGHLDGVVGISAVADTIRKFLETE